MHLAQYMLIVRLILVSERRIKSVRLESMQSPINACMSHIMHYRDAT